MRLADVVVATAKKKVSSAAGVEPEDLSYQLRDECSTVVLLIVKLPALPVC